MCVCVYVYIYNGVLHIIYYIKLYIMEYYSAKKKDGI